MSPCRRHRTRAIGERGTRCSADVYSRLRVPLPDQSIFDAAHEVLGPLGRYRMLLAKIDDQTIGVMCLLLYKDVVYYWYTGTLREHAECRAGDLLVWHAIELGHAHGCRLLDFGGAGKPDEPYGVRDFKAKYGGSLVDFGRDTWVPAPGSPSIRDHELREGAAVPVNSGDVTANRPIFVVGSVRSGTTLLRYMLCSHPRIYLTPESNFIVRCFGRRPTGELGEARVAAQSSRSWPSTSRSGAIGRARVRMCSELLDGVPRPTPESFLSALYTRYAAQHDAVRWGDKTPGYLAHLDVISTIFPRSQIVHVIRDARDVAASSLENYRGRRFFYMDAYFAARSWREQLGRGIEVGRALPSDRYCEIRYEDLTTHTESALRGLCEFLGEEYDPQDGVAARRSRTSPPLSGHSPQCAQSGDDCECGSLASRSRTCPISGWSSRWWPTSSPSSATDSTTLGPPSTSERRRTAALHTKYTVVDAGRRALGSLGVTNPTRLLRRLPRASLDSGVAEAKASVRA